MRPIFQGFCINQFGIGPLRYISISSDFQVGEPPSRVGESLTLWLGESGSRWLSDSASHRVGYWMLKRKSPSSVSRRVIDSPTHGVGKSATPQLAESESRYSKFFKFIIDLRNFKQPNQPFRGPIQQKRSHGCNVLSLLMYGLQQAFFIERDPRSIRDT
jgi:hypothetical protein